MELKLLNDQGQAASNVAAPDTIFGRDYNEALIHQLVVAYQANAVEPQPLFRRRGSVEGAAGS